MFLKRTCIPPDPLDNTSSQISSKPKLPGVDIFLNPEKRVYKDFVIGRKKETAKSYFEASDMRLLYPELFRILWFSTLPCFEGETKDKEHMLLSCELAGSKVNCSDLFKRVPTDSGICCALNAVDPLRVSQYQSLVKDLQVGKGTQKVKSRVGREMGLKLVLDLHSNTVSFGTLDQQHLAFNLFIGQPEEFPMMREKSLQLEPGREHFVDLSATVVSSKSIKGISPEARECFFRDEGDLEFYKEYAFSNCRLECTIKMAEEKYGCIPWHLPKVGLHLID